MEAHLWLRSAEGPKMRTLWRVMQFLERKGVNIWIQWWRWEFWLL